MRGWAPILLVSVMAIAYARGAVEIPGSNCGVLEKHGKLAEAKACYSKLVNSSDPFARAEGHMHLQQLEEANDEFRAADREHPKSAVVKTEWGNVYMLHDQASDAAALFEEAIQADENYAPAYLALARLAAAAYDKRAADLANEALKLDPKMAEADELLARMALEDNDPKLATEDAQKALQISDESLDAMAVLASIDWLNDANAQSPWMERILKVNPAYGEAYATGAHFFEINRRYEEAITYYRKALVLNPDLWAARSELGVNLMRLGKNNEAKEQLERCFDAHYRSIQTRNSLRFLDTVGDYQTFKTADTELQLQKNEAALLRPYMQPLMERAIATYQRKYKMTLPGPVLLQVFPNHDDFMVRTMGLPGQGGLLGVTFGLVVVMDSPSGRRPGDFNWASTMWHELSHVYVLTATHNLVPRWYTEGLAVHEEGAASPDWGDRMTPEIVEALRKKQLLPVLALDRGFVHPQYPTQVLVSYFEAGKICDYIAERWGDAANLGMIHSYAARKTTAQAIEDNLHESPEAFDKDFAAWLDKKTGETVRHFDDWENGMKAAYADMKDGKKEEAAKQATAVQGYYRDYVGSDSSYELAALAMEATGHKDEAISVLESYREAGGTGVDTLKKLAHLEIDVGRDKQAQATLQKLIYVYPEDAEVHRMFGALLLKSGDANGAVREAQASLALHPTDVAQSHYELAKALLAANRPKEAKDEVLTALEAAPNFKSAQQLLLQLSQSE